MTKEEANIALLTKIVSGDSSDNIPSIFVKKITAKKKKELIENEKLLKEYMGLKESLI
jgi:5'-3' exonuclease